MSEVRVRFAPSPTGYLHIGGVRTALYNWLFARHEGGAFILRIEDTDRERSTEEAVKVILDGLEWMGLDWDEGPFRQSERLDLYKGHADRLLSKGLARMDSLGRADKGEAVVFPVAKKDVAYDDLVKGKVLKRAEDLEPHVVLLKSDGFPTYNFGCVVDDIDMRISHVIRGDDHVANTWKQLLLYEALGETPPRFAHLPMIHNEEGRKLSKRDGAVAVTDYREMRFLPAALINYLALLGWSPGDDTEIMPKEELIERFDLSRVRPSASRFDFEKLKWMNERHIQMLSPEEIERGVRPTLKSLGVEVPDERTLTASVAAVTTRMTTFADFPRLTDFAFVEQITPDKKAQKLLRKRDSQKTLAALLPRLEGLKTADTWTPAAVERVVRGLAKEMGLSLGKVAQPLRAAVRGTMASPSIGETLHMTPSEWALARIRRALEEAT